MANVAIKLLALLGLFLSLYALYVEYRVSIDPDYVAACDIASWISCSKVLTSEFAYTFPFLPNAGYGALLYILIIILDVLNEYKYINYIMSLALLFVIYLAYVLMFILKDFCIVCVSTYVINISIWMISFKNKNKNVSQKKSKKTS